MRNLPCELNIFCASTTAESRAKVWYQLNAFKPHTSGFGCCPFYGGGSAVVDSLLIVTPIVGFCNCSMFCCALLCVHSSFAIISIGKRELVALLCLCCWCLVIVVWLFLTIPRVCLQFVIFPDHTHLLFLPNSEDPHIIQHYAAFLQRMHCLLRLNKQPSGTEKHHNLEYFTCDTLKCTMGNQFYTYCINMLSRIQKVAYLIFSVFLIT